MNITCFQITDDNHLAEVSFEDLYENWQKGAGQYWIDVAAYQVEELSAWLEKLNITDLANKIITEQMMTTRVIPLTREVLFQIPDYLGDDVSNSCQLTFLCQKNLCITLHTTELDQATKSNLVYLREIPLQEASISGLVYSLLLALSSKLLLKTGAVRSVVRSLEGRMDQDPDSVEIEEILDQSQAIRELDSIVSEQVACFDILSLVDSPALSFAANGYFQNITSVSHNLDRDLDRIESRLAELRQRYGMNQQDRTNKRLAMLTVISAIFLPLILFTGIYGMNFEDMPELKYPYAYPMALGFMASLASFLLWLFWSKGWFK